MVIGLKKEKKKIPTALDRRIHELSQGKIFGRGKQKVILSSNIYILCEQEKVTHQWEIACSQ